MLLVCELQQLLGDPLDAVKDAALVTSLFLFKISSSAGVPLSGALSATAFPEQNLAAEVLEIRFPSSFS